MKQTDGNIAALKRIADLKKLRLPKAQITSDTLKTLARMSLGEDISVAA